MLVVAGVYVVAGLSAARRRTWRFGSCPDVRVTLNPVMWHWLLVRFRAAVARQGTVRLESDLSNIVMKPLEKVLGLLVVANCEPLNVSLGLVRRDVLASSSATQPVYS
jgi:hypothetical protein